MRAGIILCAALGLSAPLPATAQPARPRAEFVTLGTGGGPIIRLRRGQPANALIVGDAVYLFDTGDGVQRQLRGANLSPANLRAIFISHHHMDHNAGLGPLLASRWLFNAYRPLPVIGPPGTRDMLANLAEAYRPVELAPITIGGPAKPTIAATIAARDLAADLNAPTLVYEDEHIRVLAVTNGHYNFPPGEAARFSRSYAFRIEAGGRSIVYTGDTGWSDNLVRLAQGADLLVTEVIDVRAMEAVLRRASDLPAAALGPMLAHMAQDHLTPDQIGRLAARARVERVVLTHLAPGMDEEPDTRGYTTGISAHYRGPVTVANDLDRF
ncbi:MAG TPA: MBL fold metallo-hydrolase [Allosphingosinicella sp.]|nr:MBL fold metallo-hydrolase [Allosphingosinicella sp.]